MQSSFLFDNLMSAQPEGMPDEELNCNFIQLLAQMKQDNLTIDFRRLYRKIQRLSYTYPLLVKNKSQVLKVLVGQLKETEAKAIQSTIIQMLIALVKDFRQDIYKEFVELILPSLIELLDITNLESVDTFFTLFSFCIKYLLKDIRSDLKNFYPIYFELLSHKNRFIRKFACQSFSYVLRKTLIDKEFIQMLFDQLKEEQVCVLDYKKPRIEEVILIQNSYKIFGLADLLFEVVYGASQSLHSKFEEIIQSLLEHYNSESLNPNTFQVFRYLYMKLLVEIRGND